MINPKFPHNVGSAQRACSIFGVQQLWYTGDRVPLEVENGKRLPREERMKGYKNVNVVQFDYPFDAFPERTVPVAVEVRPNSEILPVFVHPENAVYVFGPEDGELPKSVVRHCHRFVIIPGRHCFNLAAAINIVLYDRMVKSGVYPEIAEHRGFYGG